LEPKVHVVIQVRKHLVAMPAILGAVGSWFVVVSRMYDATVALRCTLRHIIRAVEEQDIELALGELASNACADAASTDDDNVPDTVRRLTGAQRKALAAGKCGLLDRFRGAVGLEERVAGFDVRPYAGDETVQG
jgi:hypothetical protein